MEIDLILTWSENQVITCKATRDADPDADPVLAAVNNPTNSKFEIKDAKLYVPVVTLPTQDDNKLLEQLKSGFKRTIKWNKYRSEMNIQPQDNNLNYLIDPTLTNVNRLFVLSFTKNNEGDNRDSFSDYYVPNVKINNFNVLIEIKSFFDLPVKNEEAFEKVMDISNNNDYKTGNLLHFGYFKENYRLIAIDLSKQTKLKDPQQISFIGSVLNTREATMFLVIEKSEEATFNFSQNSATII